MSCANLWFLPVLLEKHPRGQGIPRLTATIQTFPNQATDVRNEEGRGTNGGIPCTWLR